MDIKKQQNELFQKYKSWEITLQEFNLESKKIILIDNIVKKINIKQKRNSLKEYWDKKKYNLI
jgi:hypothetical protein